MNTRATLATLVPVILVGCGSLTDTQNHLLAEARSIDQYPVKRKVLVSRLGLEGLPSQRFDGSVRSRRMWFTESWEHRSGLTVNAFDSEYVGELTIVPGSINTILNAPGRRASDFVGSPEIGPARKSFEDIELMNGGKVLYRSTEPTKRSRARATSTSRHVSMPFLISNLNPVIDVRPRW